MERVLEAQTVEGEIGLVIDYLPGRSPAIGVLQAAMDMIEALDGLDAALLSSVDTSLEPVSILNDVQHSSLKMLLVRALRHVPDEHLGGLEWKKWVGGLLVKGKHKLLQKIDADGPELKIALDELAPDYKAAPLLLGYQPPTVAQVRKALDAVASARAALPGQSVVIQTELGDVYLPEAPIAVVVTSEPSQTITNIGVELFKVKSPDLLGTAQWSVLRNNRAVRVDMLHRRWLDAYHRREHQLLPGDSLRCRFEERITYDEFGNEIERKVSIIEVLSIVSPHVQLPLDSD